MNPDFSAFASWQRLFWIVAIALIPLFIVGVGDEIIGGAIAGPITTILNLLSSAFIIIVAFDVAAIIILAIIENSIEYITGDSATFKNGKMIVMTREEARAEREKDRKRVASQREKARRTVKETGPPSVYKLSFPIPGAPGDEPVTQLASGILGLDDSVSPPSGRPQREEPSVITANNDSSRIKFNPSRSDDTDDETSDEDQSEPSTPVGDTSKPPMLSEGDTGAKAPINKSPKRDFPRPSPSTFKRSESDLNSERTTQEQVSKTPAELSSTRRPEKDKEEISSPSASSRFGSLSRSTPTTSASRFGSLSSRSTLLDEDEYDDAEDDDDLTYEDVEDSP